MLVSSIRFFVCFCLYFTLWPLDAATITKSSHQGCDISLSGDIVDGDFNKLADLAKQNNMIREHFIDEKQNYLCLNSSGGSFIEGLKISEFLIKYAIATKIEDGSMCYSSCAIVFMSGTTRGEDWDAPKRMLHVGGKLGFHAPYISVQETKSYTSRDLESVFDIANRLMSGFARIFAYQSIFHSEPWMRPSLLLEMYKKERNELLFIDTIGAAGRWQIEIYGMKELARITLHHVVQACLNFQAWNHDLQSDSVGRDIDIFLRSKRPDTKTGFFKVDTGGMMDRHCYVKFAKQRIQICSVDDFKSIHHGKCPDSYFQYDQYYSMPPNTKIENLK